MNNTLKRLAEPGSRLYLVFLVLFAAATLFFKVYDLDMFTLAMAEGGVILLLIIYTVIMRRRREKQLAAYIESVTYDTENAKNNTLMNFPLPIAVFHLADSRIVWGNEMLPTPCRALRANGCSRARPSIRVSWRSTAESTSSTAISSVRSTPTSRAPSWVSPIGST